MKLWWHRLTHWEYWPFQVVYIPVYVLWLYYAIRSRSLFFFNASNPAIRNGGFMGESKKAIYDLMPGGSYPETLLISTHTGIDGILKMLAESPLTFPMIAKPDVGLRGAAVKKVHDVVELRAYAEKAGFDFLLQQWVPYPNEVGIFYVRHPKERKGRITGVVAKEFLAVTGDGQSTLEALIRATPRFALQLGALRREYDLSEIIPAGERRNLVPYGNHARGAKFTDRSDIVSDRLTDVIDGICRQIDGFYFGRLDVMYNTVEELERGENFSIIELNGAASEPTHIYDPGHSLLFAWKELMRHIGYMHGISRENNREGVPYLAFADGIREYRLHRSQNRKIKSFR